MTFRPGIAAWDTGQPTEQADPPALLSPQREWTAVAPGTTATVFQGDAIISNGRIALAARRKAQAVEAYVLSHEGMVLRLRLRLIASGGEPAARLERVELVENTKGAACLELAYKNAHGAGLAARFRIKKAEVAVQIDPGQGADRLRVECAGRYAVLPDFFADDILIAARNIPVPRIELPSENFLLHLAGQGETVATCVFENRKQDVVVTNIGESKLAATGRNITLFKGDNTGALTQWNQIQFVTNQGDNSADLPMAVVAARSHSRRDHGPRALSRRPATAKVNGTLTASARTNGTSSNLWVLPMSGDRQSRPFLETPFTKVHAQFSPDGRWVFSTAAAFARHFDVQFAPDGQAGSSADHLGRLRAAQLG